MPSEHARAYQNGSADAYGLIPEIHVSDGTGIPCRHCLENVAAGEDYLILAYRPFSSLQPYAETGPVFLHAKQCDPYQGGDALPPVVVGRKLVLLKAYDSRDRIIYGKGTLLPPDELVKTAEDMFADKDIACLHVRSAYNNCFTFRIDRA